MRTEEIWAEMVDEAAERVLRVLKEKSGTARSISSRDNVFYFDGWDGLGASAVLRAIAQRLTAAEKCSLAELEFDQVIHIDCSMWESRRALQRAVAEQLKLPDEVMEMFERQDEEDDFRGVAQGSRAEIQQVVREMHRHIQKMDRRFLVIFHNGSDEEIDLASCCSFPLSGYSTSKVLWTFRGRFRLKPRTKVDRAMEGAGTTTAVLIRADVYSEEERAESWSYLTHTEATEVATSCNKINTGGPHGTIIYQPAQVSECSLYLLELCSRGHHWIDYDFSSHGANFWVCDGIIRQLQQRDRDNDTDDADDESWRAAEALRREMRLDVEYHQFLPYSPLARFVLESTPYWTSPNYGFARIPAGAIHNGDMFRHCSDKLRVLKLSRCTFNFQLPPFLCCHSLRFLWLDHCQETRMINTGSAVKEGVHRCFQRLWVLDVRYMDCDHILSAQMLDLMAQLRELNVIGPMRWDMGQLQGRLPNIRKLRVKYSSRGCLWSEDDMFSEMNKMELLDFSGNDFLGPRISNNGSCLETIIISDGYNFEEISFKGCSKLKNLLLGGWMGKLRTLDISGTGVKTLDLTATEIDNLDELYLLGCENLCAIMWPPEGQMKPQGLSKLCIDTTQSAPVVQPSREENTKRDTTTATTGTSEAAAPHGSRPTSKFPWNISVRDARLLVSLEAVYSDSRKIYVEVSPPNSNIKQQALVNWQQKTAPAIYAADSTMDQLQLQQASEGDGDAPGVMWIWPWPDVIDLPQESCYMHIQDQTRTKLPRGGEETSAITVPEFVLKGAKILHVHDSRLSTTAIPLATGMGSEWHMLEWCRIERCPRVEAVFALAQEQIPYMLRIFWASQLPKTRYYGVNYLTLILHFQT